MRVIPVSIFVKRKFDTLVLTIIPPVFAKRYTAMYSKKRGGKDRMASVYVGLGYAVRQPTSRNN